MPSDTMPATGVAGALDRNRRDPTRLVQILREVQTQYGYISPDALTEIAGAIGLPRARVEGVAGFYSFLHTRPRGRYRVLFSDNITDRMLGSGRLLDYMCSKLWLERGKTSEDGLVSVDLTSCTGMCDQGPALLVNDFAIPRLTEERLDAIFDLIRDPDPGARVAARVLRDRRQHPAQGHPARPRAAARRRAPRGDRARARAGVEIASNERSWREAVLAAPQGPVATLEEIKRSNLRGRGGAGFTTGLKWEACRSAPGQTRYVVCNADEGEPGTFKDRVLLTHYADLVFEGMTVVRLRRRRRAGASSTCAASTATCSTTLEAVLARAARRGPARPRHPGPAGLRLRHRDPPRRRRLHLRRGVGADRVARGQARHAAQPAAVPGDARLPAAADRGEQRRDVLPRRR